jgi:hypothetical protein
MRRLTCLRSSPRDEHGAVIVLMAAFVVVIVGLSALVIDVGSIADEKRQLQNGADAAALAVAHSCGLGTCDTSLAAGLANSNSRDGRSDVVVSFPGTRRASVITSTSSGGTSILPYSFAQILTHDKGRTVHASATAGWDFVGSAVVIPLALSPCDKTRLHLGTATVIDFAVGFGTCPGKPAPGSFAWLNLACQTTVVVSSNVLASSGKSGPKDCLRGLKDTVVLLPIFDTITGTGTNATYHIIGFAALRLTGWSFPGDASSPAPCSGTCIAGTFVNFVQPGQPAGGGADFGVFTVNLVS